MSALTKRKTASPQKVRGTQEDKKDVKTPATKKRQLKVKKKHGLALQESTHSRIRNKLFWPVLLYIVAGAGFVYWHGVSRSTEVPPEVEYEILGGLPSDAKHVELPKNLRKGSNDKAKLEMETAKDDKAANSPSNAEKEGEKSAHDDFRVHVQKSFKLKAISTKSGPREWREIKHNKSDTSSVRIYVMDNFLSNRECEGLIKAHERHQKEHSAHSPVVCFSGEVTMKLYLQQAGVTWADHVTEKDFTEGTTCLNESLSTSLNGKLPWSHSTSFYTGESPFSTQYEKRVKQYLGLDPRNGGKFQVTSYPENVGYKLHTDCTVGSKEQRDRFATVLIYLNDVEVGGETEFTELGVKITPRKGRALFWNNMNKNGDCDATSHHQAAVVKKGKKYILQRWYYYQNFPTLGKRTPPPALPPRTSELTPRVSCDQFASGSCRWYDEWNYDHLTDYRLAHDNR